MPVAKRASSFALVAADPSAEEPAALAEEVALEPDCAFRLPPEEEAECEPSFAARLPKTPPSTAATMPGQSWEVTESERRPPRAGREERIARTYNENRDTDE